jgi:hypothetical protein
LLQLAEDFEQTRDAVMQNEKTLKQFKRLTHDHHPDFFASKLEAIAYLKEDVFFSVKRTQRCYEMFMNLKKNEYYMWNFDSDSISDRDVKRGQPQDSDSDDYSFKRKPTKPSQDNESAKLLLQKDAEIMELNKINKKLQRKELEMSFKYEEKLKEIEEANYSIKDLKANLEKEKLDKQR